MRNNQNVNILTIYYKHKPGGFCKRLRMKIEAYLEHGWTVHYIAVEPFSYQHRNLIPHLLNSPTDNHTSLFFWMYFFLAAPIKVIQVARQENIDLFSVFSPIYGYIVTPAIKMLKIPMILFIRFVPSRMAESKRTIISKIQSKFESIGLGASTKTYAPSSAIKNAMIKEYGTVGRRIEVFPNNIEVCNFNKGDKCNAVLKEFGIDKGSFIISTSGLLIKRKNIDFLIKVLAEIKTANIHLLIIGKGEEKSALENLSERLGVGPQVHFTGWRKNVTSLLQGTDLFLFASAQEGMSNSLLEALGCDLPCLVSSTPENRDVLINTDLLFDLDSPKILAQKIIRLAQDPTYYSKIQVNCKEERKKFIFNWSEEIVAKAESLLTQAQG